jgi:hypothetical protein
LFCSKDGFLEAKHQNTKLRNMFNLLGRQNASRAGLSNKSSQSPIRQLFLEQDVRELFETFGLDQAEGESGETAESHKLTLSKSKDGLIITQMLTKQLKEKLSTRKKEVFNQLINTF